MQERYDIWIDNTIESNHIVDSRWSTTEDNPPYTVHIWVCTGGKYGLDAFGGDIGQAIQLAGQTTAYSPDIVKSWIANAKTAAEVEQILYQRMQSPIETLGGDVWGRISVPWASRGIVQNSFAMLNLGNQAQRYDITFNNVNMFAYIVVMYADYDSNDNTGGLIFDNFGEERAYRFTCSIDSIDNQPNEWWTDRFPLHANGYINSGTESNVFGLVYDTSSGVQRIQFSSRNGANIADIKNNVTSGYALNCLESNGGGFWANFPYGNTFNLLYVFENTSLPEIPPPRYPRGNGWKFNFPVFKTLTAAQNYQQYNIVDYNAIDSAFLSSTGVARVWLGSTQNYAVAQADSGHVFIHLASNQDTPPVPRDDYYPPVEPSDPPIDDGNPEQDGANLLTQIYSIDSATANQFGAYVYTRSFFDDWKNFNPIENVVGLKLYPFTIPTGTQTTIKVGYNDSQVSAAKSPKQSVSLDGGSITLTRYFNNFFDFEPYTKLSLYIPFIGIKEIEVSRVLNHVLSIKYVCDLTTGVIRALVKIDGVTAYIFDGSCGIDIPLVSSNRAQLEAAYMQGLANTAISFTSNAITGDIKQAAVDGVAGIAQNTVNYAMAETHYNSIGVGSPVNALYAPLTAYLIIDRPKFTIPAGYGSQVGFMCKKTRRLNGLHGFTVVTNAEINGTFATEEEQAEIKQLLSTGIYL